MQAKKRLSPAKTSGEKLYAFFLGYVDRNPIGPLFIITPALLILRIVLRAQLTISNEYIRTTDGIFTFESSWNDIEKIVAYGLFAGQPVFSHKKWASPIVWRLGVLARIWLRSNNQFFAV